MLLLEHNCACGVAVIGAMEAGPTVLALGLLFSLRSVSKRTVYSVCL